MGKKEEKSSSKGAGGGKATATAAAAASAAATATVFRDESVSSVVDFLLDQIQEHINDKFIFPQIVAHAVAGTMAEVVNMVSIAHVQRMEGWLVHLEGSAPEEWDKPEEPLIPLIDTWARGVIPIKRSVRASSPIMEDGKDNAIQLMLESSNKPLRRASAMALSQYHEPMARRRSSEVYSKQGLRGSLRRFSDSLFPLDPNRKVQFQETVVSDEEVARASRRSSTPPPTDFFQAQGAETTTRRPSLTKGEKSSKATKSKSVKNKG